MFDWRCISWFQAVSTTGTGESIMKCLLANNIALTLTTSSPNQAILGCLNRVISSPLAHGNFCIGQSLHYRFFIRWAIGLGVTAALFASLLVEKLESNGTRIKCLGRPFRLAKKKTSPSKSTMGVLGEKTLQQISSQISIPFSEQGSFLHNFTIA